MENNFDFFRVFFLILQKNSSKPTACFFLDPYPKNAKTFLEHQPAILKSNKNEYTELLDAVKVQANLGGPGRNSARKHVFEERKLNFVGAA